MKKCLLLVLCTSCCLIDELPPELYIFHAKPVVEYIDFQKDGLVYYFDEPLEYEELDTLYADVYRNGSYYTTKQCDTSYVPISAGDEVDVIVSNIKLEGGRFFRIKNQDVKGFDFLEDYPYCYTDNDGFIGKRSFPVNSKDYDWDIYIDHCCTKISVRIKPVTKHYVIQLISDDVDILCDSLIISGLAYRYDILNGLVTKDLCNSYLPLRDKQVKNGYAVYASKFVSFGLPSDESSWTTITTDEVYATFKVLNCLKYVKVDITQRICNLPNGGVITIFVDIPKIDNSSDFVVDVDDWNTHIIDIDF